MQGCYKFCIYPLNIQSNKMDVQLTIPNKHCGFICKWMYFRAEFTHHSLCHRDQTVETSKISGLLKEIKSTLSLLI